MITDNKILTIPDFMIVLRIIDKYNELSLSSIHCKSKISYSHINDIKKLFLNKGWTNTRIEGTKRMLSLTDKGKEITNAINVLLEKLEINDNDIVNYKKKSRMKIVPGPKEFSNFENNTEDENVQVKEDI